MRQHQWSYAQVLPYFRKMENDADFGGEFHGKDDPVPVRRYKREEWMPHAVAFHRACVDADFRDDPDQNHPESTGVSPRARNTIDGVRISMAMAYLDPARRRMNLTIKGNVLVRRLLFQGKRAVGVEVESGGQRFTLEGEQIVLSGGAIGSPHVLLLSGVGPRPSRALEYRWCTTCQAWGRTCGTILPPQYCIGKGEKPDVQAPSIQVGLRYTVEGSYVQNDMQISPTLMTSEHRPIQ